MEKPEISRPAKESGNSVKMVRPILALAREDVGNLDAVLRGYYVSQIKSLKKRKDRKLARQLLENHLVLPKSRQRTSKDAAYIKEILGIDRDLLGKLEESRLIRGIRKGGTNPIYEVSHDTLVEPILAEKRDREAIIGFIKKTWKYLLLLLLLWFLFGMLFENSFELIPEPTEEPKRIDIVMEEQVIGIGENPAAFMLPLPPIVINQPLNPADSILVKLPLDPINLSNINTNESMGSDTISINLKDPIEVPVNLEGLPVTYQTFSGVVVPLGYANSDSNTQNDNRIFAKLSGNLKMTARTGEESRPTGYDSPLESIKMELGDTLVQAKKSAQSVPVNFNLRLTDFFANENDKNKVRNALGDRQVKLSYMVKVSPAPTQPPPKRIETPSVQGFEVYYSDGTKKFISGDDTPAPGRTEQTHIVAKGETLFSIAKQYGIVDEYGNTSTDPIKKLNGLRGNMISAGQVLLIPER